tara:strand:+ start:686 stop:1315 length:630 start_codon:yes stop_codon:yes gene_type:complete
MSEASQLLTTIVLARIEQGERYWRYQLFHPEEGPVEALFRRSTKSAGHAPPDLFQIIAVSLNKVGKSKLPFITEFALKEDHAALAHSYPALKEATSFTRTIWKNLRHAEFFPPLYTLSIQALEAFESGISPELVHFKALYRLAREEGYPVKEQWWAQKPEDERAAIADLIQKPVAEIQLQGELRAYLDDLKHYLHHQTEILIPDLMLNK